MTSKEHGLKKYKLINALTMDNPLSLVEKIKQVPEDYERYKFYLCELDQRARNTNIIQDSVGAAHELLMELKGDDGGLKVEWEKQPEIIDIEVEEND